jgi:hypothetical protein
VIATHAQIQYIKRLAIKARVDEPYVVTIEEASDAIESLQRQILLTEDTRKAIFATLRDSGKTKEDLYDAIGITSLAVQSAASEYDGQRALHWLNGETVEVRRGDQVNTQESKPMAIRPVRRPAALTREQRIPADAIPGVDADPTTGARLEFRTPATLQPILMPAVAEEVDGSAQRAINALVEALARIGEVVDPATCRAERMGQGLLAGTFAYQVTGTSIEPRVVLVYPVGMGWEDFQRRGDPATLAWTQTLRDFLRAPF